MVLREDIRAEFERRLSLIKTTNVNPRTGRNFNTDIGSLVEYGRLQEPNPDQTPGCNFADISEDAVYEWGRNARQVNFTVEAFQIDRNNQLISIANKMLEDIDSVLLYDNKGNISQTWQNCTIYEIRFVSKDPFMFEGDVSLSGVVCNYALVFDP